MASTAFVEKAERLTKCFAACLNPSHVGADNRGIICFHQDSLGFIAPTKQDGTGPEYAGITFGYWSGVGNWLGQRGMLWGYNATNYATSTFNTDSLLGYQPSGQDFAGDPGGNPTLISGDSIPWTGIGQAGASIGTCGPLNYVDGAATYPSALTFSDVSILRATSPVGTWPISFFIGNPTTTDVRVQWSWKTNSAGVSANFGVWVPSIGSQLASKLLTANTGGFWHDDSLLVPANASTADRLCQLYALQTWNDTSGASGGTKGPIAFSGIFWTVAGVDPSNSSGGPPGFAIAVYYAHGGYTGTQVNSEHAAIGVKPAAEHMRAMTGTNGIRARFWIDVFALLGHDILGSHNSFAPGDTGVGDSHDPASITSTGPIESSGAGVVQNLSTFIQARLAAWVTRLGRDPADYRCIAGFYHSSSGVLSLQQAAEQAIADAINAGTNPYMQYVVLIRGTKVVTPSEIFANIWYNCSLGSPGQTDQAHLSSAGFLGYPARMMNALVDSQNVSTAGIRSRSTTSSPARSRNWR